MAKWIEYTGSDEQIYEIKSAERGVMFWYIAGYGIDCAIYRYKDHRYHIDNRIGTKVISRYLICEPHPYADIIKIWADTGCEVWVRYMSYRYERDETLGSIMVDYLKIEITTTPDWNIPGAEYRLTPFEDHKE